MGFIADIGKLGESIFGSTESKQSFIESEQSRISRADVSGIITEQLELDPAAITRIIEEILSGPEGLASIFQGEQTAGIFNSSVSAQAAGNLTAKLVGELAKLTGKKIQTQDQSQLETEVVAGTQLTKQQSSKSGLLKDTGLADLVEKLDPTGITKDINKNIPGGARDVSIPSVLPTSRIDALIAEATTPTAISDIEDNLTGIEQRGERAIADAIFGLLG